MVNDLRMHDLLRGSLIPEGVEVTVTRAKFASSLKRTGLPFARFTRSTFGR